MTEVTECGLVFAAIAGLGRRNASKISLASRTKPVSRNICVSQSRAYSFLLQVVVHPQKFGALQHQTGRRERQGSVGGLCLQVVIINQRGMDLAVGARGERQTGVPEGQLDRRGGGEEGKRATVRDLPGPERCLAGVLLDSVAAIPPDTDLTRQMPTEEIA